MTLGGWDDAPVGLLRGAIVEEVDKGMNPREARVVAQQITVAHALGSSFVSTSGLRGMALGAVSQPASTYQV